MATTKNGRAAKGTAQVLHLVTRPEPSPDELGQLLADATQALRAP
jgi:hypothetical protein